MNEETQQPADGLTLPPAWVAALQRVDAGNPGNAGLQARSTDAPAFEARLLAQARLEMAAVRQVAHLQARRRMRFVLWTAGAMLTAASVALVVTLSLPHSPQRPRAGDIRDAFALARALRDGEKVLAEDDFNHDGAVNAHDVRALALVAVGLKGAR